MMLDTQLVSELIAQKGLKKVWVIDQTGLKRTAGNMLLTNGLLPKDVAVRNHALEKLAKILGVEVPQILLRPERSRQSA